VKSRKASDEGVRALNAPGFGVISINAPFVVGSVPGLTVKMFEFHTRYAEGKLRGLEEFAPPGGVNFISTQSLSEAIAGALERGESGKAYLVGDENLTFQSYFGQFFQAVGRSPMLQVIDQEHPLMPDTAIIWGRGKSVHYEPDPREVALLGYRRRDVSRAIQEVVAQYHRP
jgi:dihydroflavonol-4-reductase